MHLHQLEAEKLAAWLQARCRRGFRDPKHWSNWLAKYQAEIDALPDPLRKAVLLAHDQATHMEFSK